MNKVVCPNCTIAACAECIKNAGSACTVCKNGTFPPTYVNDGGVIVAIDYVVPEYEEDENEGVLYSIAGMSSEDDMSESLGDSDTSEDSGTDTDDSEDSDDQDSLDEGCACEQMVTEDNVSYAKTHMWQLMKQLQDIKDMTDLIGNQFLSRIVGEAQHKGVQVMLNLIVDQEE